MSNPTRKSIGVIGLGIIGRAIAAHLRRTGFSVFVWNRSPQPVPNFVGSLPMRYCEKRVPSSRPAAKRSFILGRLARRALSRLRPT
ncbi:MAG: hypothetical protein DMC60_13595 [Verrucomicrobia bacterium]|nr:MAG: hypothetical protein DMC60_13595 [Verrucomicrobiota bacterium]